MNTKAMKTLAVLLILLSALSALELIPMPEVMAQPTILLDPAAGQVGVTVTVTGTIETVDGVFTVRWDQTLNVTSGEAVGNDVTAYFVVPPTNASPSGRDITVELIDDTAGNVASTVFTIQTEFVLIVETPSSPKQLQEGNITSIKINVTGGLPNTLYDANITVKNPANQTHSFIAQLSNTTSTGSGNVTATYPDDFGGAHTNLTGTYYVALNDTLATSEFFVGLTDKNEYRRNEFVRVQAAGYMPSEIVTADIRAEGSSLSGYPGNFTASSGGLVTLAYLLPQNATPGTYSVTLTSTNSSGTVKTPSDTQSFNVTGVVCLVQTRNLANETFGGASVEVYNASAPTSILTKGNTNSTGWIRFHLDRGNYTFKAFVKDTEVDALVNQTITMDTELHLTLRLVNLIAAVETEEGERIPLIDIALNYNYTTRYNTTLTATARAQTNATGIAVSRNIFANMTYRAEAKRYGMLFNATTLVVQSTSGWITLNLTLPTHMLSVHALDAKDSIAAGVDVRVYEWASGATTPLRSMVTSDSGDVFFSLPFGRYVLRAYKGGDFITEAVVDLDEPLVFTFNLRALNVDVTVFVFDYLGQPIANAEVRIERKIGQEFVLVYSQFTGSSGLAQFASIIGGESRLSVYVAGKLAGVQTQFLGSGSDEVAFRIGEYIAMLGFPIASGTFALVVFAIVLVIIALVLARKRISQVFRKKSKR